MEISFPKLGSYRKLTIAVQDVPELLPIKFDHLSLLMQVRRLLIIAPTYAQKEKSEKVPRGGELSAYNSTTSE